MGEKRKGASANEAQEPKADANGLENDRTTAHETEDTVPNLSGLASAARRVFKAAAASTGTIHASKQVEETGAGASVKSRTAPILAAAPKATQDISEAKSEEKEAKEQKRIKRMKLEEHHWQPADYDLSQEQKLIRLATRGAVTLFNAVRKHQKAADSGPKTVSKDVGKMSKTDFLGMLKGGKATDSSMSRAAAQADDSSDEEEARLVGRHGKGAAWLSNEPTFTSSAEAAQEPAFEGDHDSDAEDLDEFESEDEAEYEVEGMDEYEFEQEEED